MGANTQQGAGKVLWPQTSAESTAGITPTNYYYEPGDVRRYGATGDGTTDDLSALQDANTAMAGSVFGNDNGIVYFPPGSYRITDTLAFSAFVSVQMDGTIIYDGTQNRAAVTWGADANEINFKRSWFRVDSDSQSDWTDESYIGLKLTDLVDCEVGIYLCRGFTIGCQMYGNTNDFFYNTFFLDQLVNNKIGLDLVTPAEGTLNENLFIKGRFTVDAAVGTTSDRIGIRARNGDGSAQINSNTFLAPSLEMNAANTSGTASAIDWQGCRENKILYCRNEGNDNFVIGTDCRDNHIITNIDVPVVSDTSESPSTFIQDERKRVLDPGVASWSSGPLGRLVSDYDGTNYMIPTVDVWTSTVSYPGTYGANSGVTVTNPEYVETSSGTKGFGIGIDTNLHKKFAVRRDAVSGSGGRVHINAYDANGARLTGTSPQYINGQSGQNFSTSTNYGNGYTTGSDSQADIYLECHDDVKSIDVIVSRGTSHIKLRSFSVDAVDRINRFPVTAFLRSARANTHDKYATTAPTDGNYTAGDTIYDATPSASGKIGWTCITSGTFSSATDATGDTDGSTAVITGMTDTSDFYIGNWVTVSAGFPSASDPYRILGKTSTTVTLDTNSDSSQTNVTVATVDPTFKTWGAIDA
jgi:hypothetical protein